MLCHEAMHQFVPGGIGGEEQLGVRVEVAQFHTPHAHVVLADVRRLRRTFYGGIRDVSLLAQREVDRQAMRVVQVIFRVADAPRGDDQAGAHLQQVAHRARLGGDLRADLLRR